MAEDVASIANMMEAIKVNLPRFDQCISLLRTEIDELRDGKLDHRLREVIAIPLIDPSLHSALSKAIDGGLLLPPAPELSDSEDELVWREEEEAVEEETVEKEAENGAEEEEEDGAAYADGKGAAAGGGVASGGEKEREMSKEGRAGELLKDRSHRRGERNLGEAKWRRDGNVDRGQDDATIPTATAAANKSKDRTPQCTERVIKANGLTSSILKPPDGDDGRSLVSHNGTQVESNGSPLRDRPPILSGGGSRVAPAAPPPTPQPPLSSHRANSGVIGSCHGRNDSDRDDALEDCGIGEDERWNGGMREGGEQGTGSGIRQIASKTASVTPETKSAKKTPGGDDPIGEMNGNEANGWSSSKRGRKRPRTAEGTSSEASSRLRMPQPRRQGESPEEGEGGDDNKEGRAKDDTKTVKRERADSVNVEHFRRIALEVWERVYKHKFAIIFRKPVNPKDAPGYEKVIRKPMDLGLIKQRIMSGALMSLDDLSRDFFVMCNNAMVFNGKGDPYFDYSKELRTFASEIISEARRPGFVTADPGFDSIVAGTRTSRARQTSTSSSPAALAQSAPRGRGKKKRQNGVGSVCGRRSSRESDSTSVADDTGDEERKVLRGGGREDGSANGVKRKGKSVNVAARENNKKSGGRRGTKHHARSKTEIVGMSLGEDDDIGGRRKDGRESASGSRNPSERGAGRKRAAAGKGKRRAKGGMVGSSDEDRSARGKVRKAAKTAAKRTPTSNAGSSKKRAH